MKEALRSHRENFQEGGVGPQIGVKMAQRAKMMLASAFVVLVEVDPRHGSPHMASFLWFGLLGGRERREDVVRAMGMEAVNHQI